MPTKTAALPRVLTRVLMAAAAAFVLWLLLAIQFFANPPQVSPHRTDAIVVLGGLSRERLPVAQNLQEALDIPVLVVSTTGLSGNLEGDALCRESQGDPDLLCFRPEPLNTRGEADAVAGLAAKYGWTSITVVTSDYHVMRAGTLMHQCVAADVQMVGSEPDMTAGAWLDRFVVETGGLLDVWMQPECDSGR
ncbi:MULTISPECIES: YdcF family protein [Paenarthrobacter]|uniref:YdcF family protein n=2 Tax=Micrococcaceae TaxID=1268 RepID=A0AAX3EGD7_PAEUR|nr:MULTISPECIES: YdcF family protein [Paenarthrobacter]MDO5876946.1 YdcF family protein [Paenarthrobacter sp. SD-1]UYV92156.1 YdcF family protein [Paenarthrobacter ureafaciens]UYV96692.1 YdcF family protein [Paenarthrobacter ureafaciens]WIV32055.1 YdcF family protein [Paenarthrobacter sp. R1]